MSAERRVERWTGAGADELLVRTWEPVGCRSRASVLIVHGLGEHSARYDHVGEFLAGRGLRVCAYDQRGHGLSGGRCGWVASFDDFLDDLAVVHGRLLSEAARSPLVLLGHSMGGLIATAYVLDRSPSPDLLVLSGPALAPRVDGDVDAIDAAALSHDPAVRESYRTDPLVLRERVTEELLARVFDGVVRVRERSADLACPVLLVHGGADPLCSADGARAWLEASSSPDLTVKIYEAGFHEMLNETCRDRVLGDLAAWLDERLPADPLPAGSLH